MFGRSLMCLASLLLALTNAARVHAAPDESADPQAAIATVSRLWAGSFDNHRQVKDHLARGEPAFPELTRERRRLIVVPVAMPQLGAEVLFLEEYRESNPSVAHRQRLVALVWDTERKQVRAEQWFFADLPTYDRVPAKPADVARLSREQLRHESTCDLFFTYEKPLARWRGSMDPGRCRYPQGTDGIVFAEFDMLLHPRGLWYRDRSIRTRDGSIRGEIDGFSWLLFDRPQP